MSNRRDTPGEPNCACLKREGGRGGPSVAEGNRTNTSNAPRVFWRASLPAFSIYRTGNLN